MLRFTIRDVLWLMVVVGLALGYGLERRRANDFQYDNEYLREAIDHSGYVPGGNYFGPILERPKLDQDPTAK
jgi:hypothetical protein